MNSSFNILSFDTATHTGFAVGHLQNLAALGSRWAGHHLTVGSHGVFDCTPIGEFKLDGERFANFEYEALRWIKATNPHFITYEMVVGGRNAGGRTSLIQKGFEAVLIKLAWDYRIPVLDIPAGTIKKWATGDGTLTHESKLQLCEAAKRQFKGIVLMPRKPTKSKPWDVDDNEVDALWLLDLSAAYMAHMLAKEGHMPDLNILTRTDDTQKELAKVVNAKWMQQAKIRRSR